MHDNSLLRAYAVSCGRFNITDYRDYLHAQKQGKLASVYGQQFSSIFETTIHKHHLQRRFRWFLPFVKTAQPLEGQDALQGALF